MSNRFYYFFMKVGASNCFLENARKWHGLWAGHHSHDIPNPASDGSYVFKSKMDDLAFLGMFSDKHWRDRTRVITFSGTDMIVWRIKGKLCYLRDAIKKGHVDAGFWREKDSYKSFEWFEKIRDRKDFFKHRDVKRRLEKWKFLPAEIDFTIPRSLLIAPIDSLSVYQFLNRGTFRPIFRVGPERSIPTDGLGVVLAPVPINLKRKKTDLEETGFGRFIRVYIDFCRTRKLGRLDTADNPFRKLTGEQLMELVRSILNPAQVETLASLLILDLGMTLDVGIGKGLDGVDIKGSCRHKERRKEIADNTIRNLERLGVKLSGKLRGDIQKKFSVSIQCKAKSDVKVLKGVLLIEPDVVNPDTNGRVLKNTLRYQTLLMNAFKNETRFPRVADWLNSLCFGLRGDDFTTVSN